MFKLFHNSTNMIHILDAKCKCHQTKWSAYLRPHSRIVSATSTAEPFLSCFLRDKATCLKLASSFSPASISHFSITTYIDITELKGESSETKELSILDEAACVVHVLGVSAWVGLLPERTSTCWQRLAHQLLPLLLSLLAVNNLAWKVGQIIFELIIM